MSTSALNPAEETLLCDGPFEVLKLTPGVFRADEIKRQYRRLALALHPDKNRHPDAEAAFKKLAAAFEKLVDPAQQAACLAETTRKRARQNDRSDAGSAGGGMGWGPGVEKFPRWCKEGEYVPKEKTEESTPDAAGQKERPMEDFLDDFAQQEAVFKEQVAQQAERLAERKRAKAEARAAAEQRRVDSLREDILGGSAGEEATFEAKTASWQSFNSSTSRRRPNFASSASRKGGGGRGGPRTRTSNEQSAEENARATKLGGGRGVGDRGQGGGGNRPPKDTRGWVEFKCLVCRRGFKSVEGLARHESQSELHRINVELSEVLSRG